MVCYFIIYSTQLRCALFTKLNQKVVKLDKKKSFITFKTNSFLHFSHFIVQVIDNLSCIICYSQSAHKIIKNFSFFVFQLLMAEIPHGKTLCPISLQINCHHQMAMVGKQRMATCIYAGWRRNMHQQTFLSLHTALIRKFVALVASA